MEAQKTSENHVTVQRTIVEKSYSGGGGNKFYTSDMTSPGPKAVPSSYQLRFGARRSYGYGGGAAASYRRGGSIESTVTRVTVGDGLEMSPTLITTRAEEKAALGSLNDRFVSYIDNVRGLVTRNQLLEAKLHQLERIQIVPSRASDIYDERLHNLQREYEQVVMAKTEVEIELENCYRDLDDFRKRLEREAEDRKDAENEANSLRKDVDQATLARVELEGKVESLREELDLIRRASDEDIRALTEQLASIQTGDVVVDGGQMTDLSDSLRDLRLAYDQLTQNNKFEIESFYKTKIGDLSSKLKDESSSNKNNKTEVMELRRQYQSVSTELEGLRNSNVALENQLEDAESRYQTDIIKYQSTVSDLENALQSSKDKFQQKLVDYNELLNVKLSLDLEIQTYRKLLEGEEIRMVNTSKSDISFNASMQNIERKIIIEEQVVKKERKDSTSSSSSSSESEI